MKVNVLVIGAGRSGTTSFCKHIEAHPQICFSNIKEVHFFSQQDLYDRGDSYLHSFFHQTDSKVFATADTYLMIDEAAMQRIKTYNPNMKFVVLLRNPVDRAISSFLYARNFGYQSKELSFQEAFNKEPNLLKSEMSIVKLNNLSHFYSGLYHKQLGRWTNVFPKENFFISSSESFWNNPTEVLNDFSTFAGIEKFNELTNIQLNKSSKARMPWLEQLLLNRESLFRQLIRKSTPGFVKRAIFKSGLVDQIHSMNRVEAADFNISEEERLMAEKYFSEDLNRLEMDFGIKL